MFEIEIEILEKQIEELTDTIIAFSHPGLIAASLIQRSEKKKALNALKLKRTAEENEQ